MMTMAMGLSTWLEVESCEQKAAKSSAKRPLACTWHPICKKMLEDDDECGGDVDAGDIDDEHLHCSGGGRVGRRDEGREAGGKGANFDVASIT